IKGVHLPAHLSARVQPEQVASLQAIIPPLPSAVPHYNTDGDWLDADLRPLLSDASLPARWQAVFSGFQSWHKHAQATKLTGLEIYSDGSAPNNTSRGPSDCYPAAWAFTVWARVGDELLLVGHCAHPAVPPGTPFSLGEASDDPLTAELLALGWAFIWALEIGACMQVPMLFLYDSTVAGRGAFAETRQPTAPGVPEGIPLAETVNLLRQCLSARALIGHQHVPGHAGVPQNELADQLAKRARRSKEDTYSRLLPTWPAHWLQHPLRRWAWMTHHRVAAVPTLMALESEARRLQTTSSTAILPPSEGISTVHRKASTTHFALNLATFNTLSLFDSDAPKGRKKRNGAYGMMIAGKRDILKRQFLTQRLWAIALQETRLPEVQIDAPRLSITLLVVHAPRSNGAVDDPARLFWQYRTQEAAKRREGSTLIVLADANSHVGSLTTCAIGDWHSEEENQAGEFFHQFLLDTGTMLPSTFQTYHEGSSWTWTGPGPHPTRHRLDFVGVPQDWASFTMRSWIWDDFEALQARQDHRPACLSVVFGKPTPALSYQRHSRRACRPSPQESLFVRASFVGSLQQAPSLPWDTEVDQHQQSASQVLVRAGQALCQPTRLPPKQEYLQPNTLALVHQRSALRAYLRAESHECERRLKIVAFAAFVQHSRGLTLSDVARCRASAWLQEIDVSTARALDWLHWLTAALRAAVRRDRATYLQSLVDNISLQDLRHPQALYGAVRKAFPKAQSARKSNFQPLPAVKLADGTLAPDSVSRSARWLEYFAEQEAGHVIELSEYTAGFAEDPVDPHQGGPHFQPQALPSLLEIEQQVVRLPFRKAAGPDQITGELLRLSPAFAAQWLYPLYLKASIGLREPSAWRGGSLICLAKRASTLFQCTSFRSILLANLPGKIWHRVLRDKLTPAYQACKGDLQAGQLPGVGTDSISLAVRLYQSWARYSGLKSALVFYDVKTAFYKLLREALVPTGKQELNQAAYIAEAGAGPHLVSMVADILRGTWFRLDGATALVLTGRGSRPGDPLADLLFSFTFATYFHSSESALAVKGLSTPVPGVTTEPPWHTWQAVDTIGCAAWADDYVHLQADADARRLEEKVVQSTTVLCEHATSLGMQLSFDREKTAVLFSADCPRCNSAHTVEDPDQGMCLRIMDSIRQCWRNLPIVDSYRHLGGVIVANGTPGVDIAFRFSQANHMLKPLYGRLFSSSQIPINIRRTLLRALVLSRFVFSGAGLFLHTAQHGRQWHRLYIRLWRGLLKWHSTEQTPHPYDVLRAAQAPSPPLALAQMRSVLLSRLLRHGPATLLHLVHAQWCCCPTKSWLNLFQADLQAVAVYCPQAQLVLQQTCPVRALVEAHQDNPKWWPAMIKKAIASFQRDLHERAPSAPLVSAPANMPFACRFCGARFALRKHQAVHEARSHGAISLVRYYAPDAACHSCMKWYHTVDRVQYHLKTSPACLQRLGHVLAPLALDQVHEAEAADKHRKRQLRRGQWRHAQTALPAQPWYGPRLPDYADRTTGLTEDDFTLAIIQQAYHPKPEHLEQIRAFLAAASREGPRQGSQEFWFSRPNTGPPSHPCAFLDAPL
ncbi:unnamed protein product, partial [Symbiodinium sp. CCMP2456]